jgi:hypothetical protein
LLLSGCDLVFTLEPPTPEAVCGPYKEIAPQSFEGLVEVTDFSVDRTGNTGFVMAKRNGDLRLTPIVQHADNAWSIDASRLFNLDMLHDTEGVRIGRTSPSGDLFASQFAQEAGDLRVFRYALSPTNMWAAESFPVSPASSADATLPAAPSRSTMASVPTGSSDTFDPTRPRRWIASLIATSDPDARSTARGTADGQLVTTINRVRIHAGAARGPQQQGRMATRSSRASSMVFLSEKIKARFPVGARLDELDGPGAEREPFLSEDCSTIYFRRGDAIIKAQAEPQ